MKEFKIILAEIELNDNFEPISRKAVTNNYIVYVDNDCDYFDYITKKISQDTINKFIEQRYALPSVEIKQQNDKWQDLKAYINMRLKEYKKVLDMYKEKNKEEPLAISSRYCQLEDLLWKMAELENEDE